MAILVRFDTVQVLNHIYDLPILFKREEYQAQIDGNLLMRTRTPRKKFPGC
jgi:hypothetical protein